MKKINLMTHQLLLLISTMAISLLGYSQTVEVSGNTPLRKWDKIVVSLTLPSNISESDTSFRNNRMDVVFTDPNGKTIRVPGFFAADGDAANTNAKTGNKFKAYLRPYETGDWNYQVLYYTGTDVALQEVSSLPSPIHDLSGAVGTVTSTNAVLPDLRAKGRLLYQNTGTDNERRYLKWTETGEYLLKFGPDSPENMLDYNDFDHDVNKNGCGLCTEHKFNPHADDWQAGDPTWNGGKGKNLIGAVNYLRALEMNSMSMSLFGGDDKNVFPWTSLSNKYQFDVSKLEQWEIVFDHAESNGLMLHFKLAEAENWDALSLDQIKVYYREMVARFSHHLAIEWNISEEFGGKDGTDPANSIPRIDWLASIDPWQNHRVLHTYPGAHETHYNYLIANNAKITGASIQSARASGYDDAYDGKSGIKTWIDNSKGAGKPWVVASDEQNPGSTGMFATADISTKEVIPQARKKILWKGLMAGGSGVMWYGGSQGDFQTEDFDRFSILFDWTKIAILQFFKGHGLEYWKMQNNDALASGNLNRCLAEEGKTYVIYLEQGGTTDLDLTGQTGDFDIKWFNPRTGGDLFDGSVTVVAGGSSINIGNPPNSSSSDWVALIRQTGRPNVAVTGLNVTPETVELEKGKTVTLGRLVLPAEATNKTVTWSSSAPDIATVSANGVVTAIAEGLATITGTTQEGGFTDSAVVTVVLPEVIDLGCPFIEKDGLLVIEAESALNYNEALFTHETAQVGTTTHTGTGYLRYGGPNHFGAQVAIHTIAYKIKITNPGVYRFLWRNVRDPQAATGDAGNDAWLNITGNNVRYFGKKNNVEYTLNKHTKHWIQRSNFVYETYGETNSGGTHVNGMSTWADFPVAGEYIIEYGGRSKGHCVDRIVLFKADQEAAAKNVNTPESLQEGTCEPEPICQNVILNAVDFPITPKIDGFEVGYVDNARNAMAINAAQHKDKFAAVKQTFTGIDGTYNIALTTLAELDGESTYVLKVGGVEIGTYQNPETDVDYTPTTKTWEGVSVKSGDEIQVEFNSHTNGKIPEGGGTAYSRGRWTQLVFLCPGSPNPSDPETVAFLNFPDAFSKDTTTFSVEAIYSANETREINFALKTPDNKHINQGVLTVPAGTDQTVVVSVSVPAPLAPAPKYKFVVALRPVGGDFSSNINREIDFADIVDALSVNEETLNKGISVYPNPLGNKKITIKLHGGIANKVAYSIFDLNGRLILSGKSEKKIFEVSSQALKARGVYILKVNDGSAQFIQKIVK
ncbi:Ig-like domain-containing protein [Flavivirga abyssicola]|uniref:Ig-like domain-containing protein n=1 Tax=Flavivirga abyssicola TaxID=3063533 RepID=UPI0026DF47DF|nr:Ig-like domain-containing protein [Flavivirga sp. MEBiC07777]WVK13586.1 Ig-like domain-containing protein [Flavivirga sp. MEBiC07777]